VQTSAILKFQFLILYMRKLSFLFVPIVIAFCLPLYLVAQGYENIANTRTPLNVNSQVINNTPKQIAAAKPPMGWNSWDNFGLDITEAEFKAQVDYVSKNLKQYGYEYMVIDAGWYAPHLSALKGDPFYSGNLTKYSTNVDQYGRWIPAVNKFPSAKDGSFKDLADYVHSKGLKFGLHIQRGIPWSAIELNSPIMGTSYHAKDIANPADACTWWDATLGVDMSKPGAQEYYNSCFELYANWGVDFVKVDDMSSPYHADEITAIRMAIEKANPNMVYSLSPGTTPLNARYHVQNNADMWRISDDFWDTWPQLKSQFPLAERWMQFRKEGHWPNLDMLPIGIMGSRSTYSGEGRRSRFTNDELQTMMTLWCMFRSPLILGGDLLQLNAFEERLIKNKQLIDIDQNSRNCQLVFGDSNTIIYAADKPGTSTRYISFFNIGNKKQTINYSLNKLGFNGAVKIREVWNDKESEPVNRQLSMEVNAHGVALFIVSIPRKDR
jgi:alpha-galactosidase